MDYITLIYLIAIIAFLTLFLKALALPAIRLITLAFAAIIIITAWVSPNIPDAFTASNLAYFFVFIIIVASSVLIIHNIYTNIRTKSEISWLVHLCAFSLFQTCLALIAYASFAGYDLGIGKECMDWDMQCTPYIEKGSRSLLALAAWFMNPASSLPDIPITETSWLIYILFLFHKAIVAAFSYKIAQDMRRPSPE